MKTTYDRRSFLKFAGVGVAATAALTLTGPAIVKGTAKPASAKATPRRDRFYGLPEEVRVFSVTHIVPFVRQYRKEVPAASAEELVDAFPDELLGPLVALFDKYPNAIAAYAFSEG